MFIPSNTQYHPQLLRNAHVCTNGIEIAVIRVYPNATPVLEWLSLIAARTNTHIFPKEEHDQFHVFLSREDVRYRSLVVDTMRDHRGDLKASELQFLK